MRPETPQNRPQYHRLRRIVAMVRDGMAGGRLPNRSDFRRELEVSPRTLARDIDFLRDEERAPIAYEPARHGYRLTDATYDLPTVNLSRREVFSFSLARKMLHAFEGTPLEMDMRSTLDKIAGSLEGKFAVSLDALTEHMSVQTEDRVVIDPAIWEVVARAIERRDILRADYRRFDGKISGLCGFPKFRLSVSASGIAPVQAMFRAASATAIFAPSRGYARPPRAMSRCRYG